MTAAVGSVLASIGRHGSKDGYTFGQAPNAQVFVLRGIEPIESREKCYPPAWHG
jgi:hypothetical protein